jgi:hypothetical protein
VFRLAERRPVSAHRRVLACESSIGDDYETLFRVARLDPSSDGCLFEPLEAEQDFNITQLDLNQFEPLVRRFLVNGSATHRKAPRPDSPDSAQRQFDLG